MIHPSNRTFYALVILINKTLYPISKEKMMWICEAGNPCRLSW